MTWFHLRRVCLQKVGQPFFGRPWPICPEHDSNHLKVRAIVPLQPPASAMSFDLRLRERVGCQLYLRFSAWLCNQESEVVALGELVRSTESIGTKGRTWKKHHWQPCTDVCFGLFWIGEWLSARSDCSTPLCTLQAVSLCVYLTVWIC